MNDSQRNRLRVQHRQVTKHLTAARAALHRLPIAGEDIETIEHALDSIEAQIESTAEALGPAKSAAYVIRGADGGPLARAQDLGALASQCADVARTHGLGHYTIDLDGTRWGTLAVPGGVTDWIATSDAVTLAPGCIII